MVDVYVGLGSNIRPERNLVAAVAALERSFGELRCSRVYRSPPYGFEGRDFLNLVVAFENDAPTRVIEDVLSALERAAGRGEQEQRGGSRTLDLDLLLLGRRVDPAERLPREDVLLYPFVLAPLVELADELRHPVTGLALAAAWRQMAATQPPLHCVGTLRSLA